MGDIVAANALATVRDKTIRGVATLMCIGPVVLIGIGLFRGEALRNQLLFAACGAAFAFALVWRRTHPERAGMIATLGVWLPTVAALWVRDGLELTPSIFALTTALILSACCWSWSGTVLLAVLSSLTLGGALFYRLELSPIDAGAIWLKISLLLLVDMLLLRLARKTLLDAVSNAISQERRLADLIRHSHEGVMLLDSHGRITLMNQRAELITQGAEPEPGASGTTSLSWLAAKSKARLAAHLQEITKDGTGTERFSLLPARGDENFEGSLSVIESRTKEKEFLLVLRDVTAQRAVERSQKELDQRIAESKSIEALGRLAGGIAHDFNNLLTVILGTTDLLRSGRELDKETNEELLQVQQAAERAAELTTQLLAVGRKQVLRPQVLRPDRAIEKLLPLLRRLLPANIDIRLFAAPSLGNVLVDTARLEQIIVNLVVNARDAMPNGGKLTIESSNQSRDACYAQAHPGFAKGDYVQIAVCDTGEGMSSETLSRLFEPFFTTKEQGRGTGLGLATVHGIVRQSGGHVYVYSEPGKGACFRIYLPRVAEAISLPPSESAAEETALPPLCVLLVEDQESVRGTIRRMLTASGHQVVEASNGEEALTLQSDGKHQFDVLITDVVMPKLGGPELAKRLAECIPELSVLYVTGYTENAIVHNGVLDEGIHCLTKPFTQNALNQALRRLV